jgi:hypothetical protein
MACAIEGFVFESGPGEHHVEGHGRAKRSGSSGSSAIVTSTSALSRGTPYITTA